MNSMNRLKKILFVILTKQVDFLGYYFLQTSGQKETQIKDLNSR